MTTTHSLPTDHAERVARMRASLEGSSVGDAFGEQFFAPREHIQPQIDARELLAPAPWRWTDDTAMTLEIVNDLTEFGQIDPARLSRRLLTRWHEEPWRGYGGGAHRLFMSIAQGAPWDEAASALFGGQGSFGNGAAMRAAVVGAYFAPDLDLCVEQARRSAIPTHTHPEGIAGAIAVAVAAAVLWRTREEDLDVVRAQLFSETLARTPVGETRELIDRASRLTLGASVELATARLGNGARISAPDTVGYCLWCVARSPRDYEDAMWGTVSGFGDRDTTCAIVGGILGAAGDRVHIPPEWSRAREELW